MKTKLFYLLSALLLVCNQSFGQADSLSMLIERAKWGDTNAFKELADRNLTGRGVKKNFLYAIVRAAQAEEHGGQKMEDYLKQFPKEGLGDISWFIHYPKNMTHEKEDSVISYLSSSTDPDIEGIIGMIYIKKGDTIAGKLKIKNAAKRGSDFSLLGPMIFKPENISSQDSARLASLAESHSFAYMILGKICKSTANGHYNRDMAAYYMMNAHKNAWLSIEDADWLLEYYHNGGSIHLSDTDVVSLTAFRDVNLKMDYPSDSKPSKDVNWDNTISLYLDKACQGDGKAYLKVARLYGGGMGMDANLTEAVSMGYMAKSYGALPKINSIFTCMSKDSPLRIFYNLVRSASKGKYDKTRQYGNLLDSMSYHGELFAESFISYFKNKKRDENALVAQLIKASNESDELAQACLLLYDLTADKDTFTVQVPVDNAADFYPVLYNVLAHRSYIAGDIEQAEKYYLKATDVFLTREGAKWLLAWREYKSRKFGTTYDKKDTEKLRKRAETKSKKTKHHGK